MAAPGGDSLAILLPVPNLRAPVDWERAADGLRDALVADLEQTFGLEGLDRSVRVEHRMAPPDFAREFGAVDGNAFAVEPTLQQSAYFRAPNRVTGVAGLYHVGAGTHPGAGIPGVLLGAQVTAGLVSADTRVA
jgi:phytoene desaturase